MVAGETVGEALPLYLPGMVPAMLALRMKPSGSGCEREILWPGSLGGAAPTLLASSAGTLQLCPLNFVSLLLAKPSGSQRLFLCPGVTRPVEFSFYLSQESHDTLPLHRALHVFPLFPLLSQPALGTSSWPGRDSSGQEKPCMFVI